jgi:hypothetical protein
MPSYLVGLALAAHRNLDDNNTLFLITIITIKTDLSRKVESKDEILSKTQQQFQTINTTLSSVQKEKTDLEMEV